MAGPAPVVLLDSWLLLPVWVLLWACLALALPLFLWQVVRGLRLARRHSDADGRGGAKVAVAALVGLLLFAGGVSVLGALPGIDGKVHGLRDAGFEPSARAGMYAHMDASLQAASGEKMFQEQSAIVKAKTTQIAILVPRIPQTREALVANETRALANDPAELRDSILAREAEVAPLLPRLETDDSEELAAQVAALDASLAANWTKATANDPPELAKAVKDLRKATLEQPVLLRQARADKAKAEAALAGDAAAGTPPLAENSRVYALLSQASKAQDDARIRAIITDANNDARATNPSDIYAPYPGMSRDIEGSLTLKDASLKDLHMMMLWFLYPSLVGLLLAPLVFAQGSILRNTYVPSDSVGFKPYPYVSAGLFLLLGAFGIPSLYFAAWTFRDIGKRSLEGQIAL